MALTRFSPVMTDTIGAPSPDAEVVALADGGRILVRRLLRADREELAQRYLQLSPVARRLRFINPPGHLSDRLLDSLLDVAGPDRCALVAVAVAAEDSPGVGLARYVRSREDPALAEAAVTVVDAYQQRGIATALLQRLAGEARRNGISTFTATVMWENGRLLDRLRAFGAEVSPSEPGVASVRIALPDADVAAPECQLRRALRVFAARVDEMIVLRFDR